MSYPASWTAIVSAISAEVVSELAAAGYPPLTPRLDGSPGQVEIGSAFVSEHSFAPRIVMVPQGFSRMQAGTRDVTSRTLNGTTPDRRGQRLQRAIATQDKLFTVYVWGCAVDAQGNPTPDPGLDYDAAQELANVFWRSMQQVAPGVWQSTAGAFDPGGATLVRAGRVLTFDLSLQTPVAELQAPVTTAAPGLVTQLDGTFGLEIGCQS